MLEKITLGILLFQAGVACGVYLGWWTLKGHNIHISIEPKPRDCLGGHDPKTGGLTR